MTNEELVLQRRRERWPALLEIEKAAAEALQALEAARQAEDRADALRHNVIDNLGFEIANSDATGGPGTPAL